MTEAQEIGARIKTLRQQNNLTQQELADRLHYKSRSTINKIELGINEIHPTKIFAFARALNTSPEFILGWKNNSKLYENKVDILFEDGSFIKFTFDNNKIKQIIEFLTKLENE